MHHNSKGGDEMTGSKRPRRNSEPDARHKRTRLEGLSDTSTRPDDQYLAADSGGQASAFEAQDLFHSVYAARMPRRPTDPHKLRSLGFGTSFLHLTDSSYSTEQLAKLFFTGFVRIEQNAELLEKHQRNKFNRTGAKRPSCISFVECYLTANEGEKREYCLVAISRTRNSRGTPGYNQEYKKLYEQLNKYACKYVDSACPFLVVDYSRDEFHQFVQKNLKRLGAATAEMANRFCAEKFFIPVLAKVNAKYGSANVIEGVVNIPFYPYRHEERQVSNFANYISPPNWNSRAVIDDDEFFIAPIPMCQHCQANAVSYREIVAAGAEFGDRRQWYDTSSHLEV
jgi:hypothetical protein